MLEEMRKDDQRVKYLWEVLEKFSNEDRSRFLRFVTGRRRLPAVMHVVGELVLIIHICNYKKLPLIEVGPTALA